MSSERDAKGAPLAGRRILAIDDDPDICRMIVTVLEAAGARVDPAVSGAQADQRLAATGYDAVLLDWNLQDMTAMEFLARVERTNAGVTARIIVMTGDLIGRVGVHEAERRGLPLLRKPFRPKELIAAVASLGAAKDE